MSNTTVANTFPAMSLGRPRRKILAGVIIIGGLLAVSVVEHNDHNHPPEILRDIPTFLTHVGSSISGTSISGTETLTIRPAGAGTFVVGSKPAAGR
jgi:hypothetical protein